MSLRVGVERSEAGLLGAVWSRGRRSPSTADETAERDAVIASHTHTRSFRDTIGSAGTLHRTVQKAE